MAQCMSPLSFAPLATGEDGERLINAEALTEAIEDAAYWQAIEDAEETDATDRAEYLRAIGATL